jgi:KUP system potassium uptake protein
MEEPTTVLKTPVSKAAKPIGPLALTALGVVFGDIGTSPLYTFKTVIELAGGHPSPTLTLGLVSLVIWTLIVITAVKYASFVMRVDNDGEGGILALMSLLGAREHKRPIIVVVGLLGAALIYGDGAITPAISVLSALEGLQIATTAVTPYLLPAAVVILLGLFAVQPLGTASIGRVFGPVMTLWFVVIGVMGIWGIAQHPSVLVALDPRYAFEALFGGGAAGFVVLGGVFLCVTGAEALYADMGHVGARPIRLAWYGLVMPALVLNYAGQAAIMLGGADASGNIFFRLCPPVLLVPMVILSTVATIIASQSIITGAFSMTRQAILLGWCPRLRITQTSSEGYGQIYVGVVNWMLMAVTIGLTLGFRKSDNLAAAYGIAVSLTMFLTSVLLFIAMREIWRWPTALAAGVAGCFGVIDAGFAAANGMKFFEGGWVPLLLATLVWALMDLWHRGTGAVVARLHEGIVPVDAFLADIEARAVARVPGTAVFLTRTQSGTPPVMVWHVRQNRALQRNLVAVNVTVASVPYVNAAERLTGEPVAPGFWRLAARYGFMERPDLPVLLAEAGAVGCKLPFDDVTYYVGHETVLPREEGGGWPAWLVNLFAFMLRNSATLAGALKLPCERVVEIGRLVEI